MRFAMARLGGEPLGMTIKTSKEPTGELPGWLDSHWRRLAHYADGFIRGIHPPTSKRSIRGRCEGPDVAFSQFLLLAFLRSYHPEVHRLLAYDPSLVADLHSALTEGAASPRRSSPVYLFFRRTFRHARRPSRKGSNTAARMKVKSSPS